jgi:phosphate transport system substrate-binding protein
MKKAMLTLIGLSTLALVSSASAQTVKFTGAGATFPFPLYSKYFAEYKKISNVEVNYQSIGSGGGIKQILAQTVDFGASDAPMTDKDLATAPGGNKILHIPTSLGAVVAAYNIPGVTTSLKFTGPILADIFLGKIKTWNDPELVKLNPSAGLPALPITTAHRSDGSGTSFVFTDYLSKVSPEWKTKIGAANTVEWIGGVAGKGNEGVAGLIQQVPGTIGYIELIYAKQNTITYGTVQNKTGKFIEASTKTVTEAAGKENMPADARLSITNSAVGYPISSYTYLLVYTDLKYGTRDEKTAKELVKMVSWVISGGQRFNEALGYARLPQQSVGVAKKLISSINFGGKAL